jgi:tRNA A58 N-methylase Trm61
MTSMSEYHSSEEERLQHLQQTLDPLTFRRIEHLGVKAGWRVLEMGAGEGSVAHWLAKRVGTQGTVVATDIDPRLMGREHELNMEVRRHDILVLRS